MPAAGVRGAGVASRGAVARAGAGLQRVRWMLVRREPSVADGEDDQPRSSKRRRTTGKQPTTRIQQGVVTIHHADGRADQDRAAGSTRCQQQCLGYGELTDKSGVTL